MFKIIECDEKYDILLIIRRCLRQDEFIEKAQTFAAQYCG